MSKEMKEIDRELIVEALDLFVVHYAKLGRDLKESDPSEVSSLHRAILCNIKRARDLRKTFVPVETGPTIKGTVGKGEPA